MREDAAVLESTAREPEASLPVPSDEPFVGMYYLPEDAIAPDHYWVGILLIEPPCAFLVSLNAWTLSNAAADLYLVSDVLTLARNTTRYDPYTRSIQTGAHGSVTDGDVVVVTPGVLRENRYDKSCPGDMQVSADIVVPVDDVEHLSPGERQYVESLRRHAVALFAQTAHTRPCERLGVCPAVAHVNQSLDAP